MVINSFPTSTVALRQRVGQTSHHLPAVLANFKDYHALSVTMPLECYTLLETFYLTKAPNLELYALKLSEREYSELDAVIRVIIPNLAQAYRSLAFFIHKVAIWLQSGSKSADSHRVISEISNSIRSLELSKILEDDVRACIMLLATTVIDACDCIHESSVTGGSMGEQLKGDSDTAHEDTQDPEAMIALNEKSRSLCLLLLQDTHKLLLSISCQPPLMHWMAFMIRYRLLKAMSPQ